MYLELELQIGKSPAVKRRLEQRQIIVGTHANCDIVIDGDERQVENVAGRHAQIDLIPEGIRVRDLDSDRGTLVNGRVLIEPVMVRKGSKIQLGRLGPTLTIKDFDVVSPVTTGKSNRHLTVAAVVAATVLIGIGFVGFQAFSPKQVEGEVAIADPPGDLPSPQVVEDVAPAILATSDEPAPVAEMSSPPVQRPSHPLEGHYALLIGVSGYDESTGFLSLKYPEVDVEALADVLINELGYLKENVMVMTASRAAQGYRFAPTADNIRKEVAGFLQNRVETDSVLIAFSGHGVQFAEVPYFCPTDADLDDRSTLVSYNEVYSGFNSCAARVKFLLTDACRDDPVRPASRRAVVDLESDTRPQEIEAPGGVGVLFGCARGQRCWEHEELGQNGHGVFFNYIIEALRQGDVNHDQQITISEICQYTQKRTKDFVWSKYSEVQTPSFKGEFVDEPVLINLR